MLVLRMLRGEAGPARFGFTAGRALGGAVVRNRVKRRLREAARRQSVKPGWSIVLNARVGAAEASYTRLESELSGLLARAGLLENGR
jgi:ribonuclease P protein component